MISQSKADLSMVPYGAIDLIYGFPTLESGHGFTNAQALMNIIEAILNVEYLYLRHTSPRTIRNAGTETGKVRPRYHAQAPLVGFAASIMTVAKTSLYFLQEYYGGWSMVKHNSALDLVRYYILPNVSKFVRVVAQPLTAGVSLLHVVFDRANG